MTKRRLTKQQTLRIEKQHQRYRELNETERDDTTLDGLVITRYSRHALIEDAKKNHHHCSIRPSIDSLVAGDHVIWQEEGNHQGVILSRQPRQSVLGRPEQRGNVKAIAANISHMIIVIAPQPFVSWMLLDSYLVMAEYLNIHASILLNKSDLECDDLRQTLLQIYEPLGYPILFTSRLDENDKQLLKALNHQVNVFVGQSGVGKSSLIARLLPHEKNILTASLSSTNLQGCHTTTHSHYYHLPTGGALIDSPGVREFGLWNMPPDHIAKGYREFKPYLNQCKFRNCTHRETPGCAIANAVKNKIISSKRYENYVKMSTQFAI